MWDRFDLAQVMPGVYRLSLTLTDPQAEDYYVNEVLVQGRNIGTTLTVGEEFLPGMLEVRLEKGASVMGTAYDGDSKLRGVYAVLAPVDADRRNDERYLRSAPAAIDGSFSLRGIPPGDYVLILWPRSDVSALASPEVFPQIERFGQRLTVERGGQVVVSVRLVPEVERLARTLQ
jgi:hypothetical protein